MQIMLPLKGFTILLLFQCFGVLLAQLMHWPFPGPVLGMLLLLPCLYLRPLREPVQACANFLLSHLSLLFIPVSVGILKELDILKVYGVQLFLILLFSCALGLLVTGYLLSRWLPDGTSPQTEEGLSLKGGTKATSDVSKPKGDHHGK